MIKGYFFPKLSEETRKIMTFQQDNATPHVSKSTLKFFADNRIPVLEWPTNSPDLNPMENMWAILIRKVYANGRIYETLTELKHAIDEAWENIELETVGNLVRSFRGRVLECAIRKEKAIQGHLSL